MKLFATTPFKGALTLFIYRSKRGTCSAKTIYRKLHGFTQIKIKKTEFGGVIHKPYPSPGIPHQDIIPGVFCAKEKDEKEIAEFFDKHNVPFIKIKRAALELSKWYVHTEGVKSP